MSLWPTSPKSLRRQAETRGADPTRWLLSGIDLGQGRVGGETPMNHTFCLASADDLLFFECEPELYHRTSTIDPFDYALEYLGRMPKAQVLSIRVGALTESDAGRSRKRQVAGDATFNLSLGKVLGVTRKTVSVGAVVVLETPRETTSARNFLAFGVPPQDRRWSLGILGRLVPEGMAALMEIGGAVASYNAGESSTDSALQHAGTIALGFRSLLQRDALAIEPLGDEHRSCFHVVRTERT